MAPRATNHDFVSSTLVEVRSVSPRTLVATASPMAESAAVSQRTVSNADPLRCVDINSPRSGVDVECDSDSGNVQICRRGVERRHLDAHPLR